MQEGDTEIVSESLHDAARAREHRPSERAGRGETAKHERRWRTYFIGALGIVVLGGAYYVWSHYAARHPSTSDAYVRAHVVHIAPQVTGTIQSVGPESFAHVAKGDLLIRIDPRPFEADVHAAEAALAEAQQTVATLQSTVDQARAELSARRAALEDARKESERVLGLVAQGSAPQASGDSVTAALREARAGVKAARSALSGAVAALGVPGEENPRVLQARAKLEQARLMLANTTILAPADGYVGRVEARAGSLAGAGVELMQMVETDTWWVDANFKEADLGRIKPGQTARVSVDMLPGRQFRARVVALSPASGASFSLFPPENATGNWVKVAQRFPVRIQLDTRSGAEGLRMGASSSVSVDTTSTAQ
ncbi:MAG: HlyD family secretion protein [Gammaproteobacteria bacterium]|nr:HlyD family secretion protein [Gammaproteobacteria bacterium]